MKKINVLFVCMGNICRSPTSEGLFQHLVTEAGLLDKITIDSAGTHAYHVGNPPDTRATAAAKLRGIDLTSQRARQVCENDFTNFDYILAMDNSNHADLSQLCPAGEEHRLHLFLDFAPQTQTQEVPDPYYGGEQGFEHVLDLVEQAAAGLLEDIKKKHL